MRRGAWALMLAVVFSFSAAAQRRISKEEVAQITKELKERPLLAGDDADFKGAANTAKWNGESAVILCQKTAFTFDKKGLSAGKRIGRNIWGVLFALPTLGTSLILANMGNETRILIEETERKRILLKDKFALEQYSVLYFRLAAEGDAFKAQVIKKDGSVQAVDISEAVLVSDLKTVPGLFRSYTDESFSARYRPDFFKIAIPDLEEGDVIEYEFKNFNTQVYAQNPDYKEFDPVYYLCSRDIPVSKQVIEVATEDDKYYIGYKSLKGAPQFSQTLRNGKKLYRWEDGDRDKLVDTRFVNELTELPSIKFQVIYARNNSQSFIWAKDEAAMKQDLPAEVLAEKAALFWFQPGKLRASGDFMSGIVGSSSTEMARSIYKGLRKKGITDAPDDVFVQKAYYMLRSQTAHRHWSDYAFAKVFSALLQQHNLQYDILVTAPNSKTALDKIAFSQELAWIIGYKDKYYYNPQAHRNPGELPVYIAGNSAIKFTSNSTRPVAETVTLPLSDTLANMLQTRIKASLDTASLTHLSVDKQVEAVGLLKADFNEDILSLTPYMEADFRNYDGVSMYEGMSAKDEEKLRAEFDKQKKDWKEEKPEMMKSMAESEYGFEVKKYNNFKLQQDGRSAKKPTLKWTESFTLADVSATAGNDLILPVPALVGEQLKVKSEERSRQLPINVRYPRKQTYSIVFTLPAGYNAVGLEALQRSEINASGSFNSTARLENNTLVLDVAKTFSNRQFEVQQWPQLMALLDAAYAFSQSKIVLKKQEHAVAGSK